MSYVPGTQTAYIAQPTSNTVLAMDAMTGDVIESIPALCPIRQLAIDRGLNRLYGVCPDNEVGPVVTAVYRITVEP